MKTPRIALALALALASLTVSAAATAQVTTGKVIRGLTLSGPAGVPDTPTGTTCDFSGEDVDQANKMTGASVNCKPGSSTKAQVIPGLPARFNAYCMIDAPVKSARVIQAGIPGNTNHCDLSGITPKDATNQFGGALWR